MPITIERRARSVSSRRAVPGSTAFAALAGVLALALSFAPAAGATIINYGTFEGTDVHFSNVSEASSDSLPLFGSPTVSGNSLDFNPLGFGASSTGVGSKLTSGNLSFMVVAKPGNGIEGITLSEAGNVTLLGNVAPGSMGTAAAVFAGGVLDIHEVDFVGIDHISVPFSLTFSPSGGTYFLGTDGGGGPMFSSQWTGFVTLDVEAILVANGFALDDDATKVSVNVTNTLAAVSQNATSALIGKNDVSTLVIEAEGSQGSQGSVGVAAVPEPGMLTLIGAGLIALMLRGRRPSSA
jgi:hypothetical protein